MNILRINDNPEGLMQIAELQIFGILGELVDNEGMKVPEFNVFPNPTDGMVNIYNPSHDRFSYEIYSVSSNKVYGGNNSISENTQLNLSDLSKGIYIIVIRTKETTVRHKIILH